MGDAFADRVRHGHFEPPGLHGPAKPVEKRLVVVHEQKGLVFKLGDGFAVISHESGSVGEICPRKRLI